MRDRNLVGELGVPRGMRARRLLTAPLLVAGLTGLGALSACGAPDVDEVASRFDGIDGVRDVDVAWTDGGFMLGSGGAVSIAVGEAPDEQQLDAIMGAVEEAFADIDGDDGYNLVIEFTDTADAGPFTKVQDDAAGPAPVDSSWYRADSFETLRRHDVDEEAEVLRRTAEAIGRPAQFADGKRLTVRLDGTLAAAVDAVGAAQADPLVSSAVLDWSFVGADFEIGLDDQPLSKLDEAGLRAAVQAVDDFDRLPRVASKLTRDAAGYHLRLDLSAPGPALAAAEGATADLERLALPLDSLAVSVSGSDTTVFRYFGTDATDSWADRGY